MLGQVVIWLVRGDGELSSGAPCDQVTQHHVLETIYVTTEVETPPRISRLTREQVNPETGRIFDVYLKARGNVPNIFRTVGKAELRTYFDEGKIVELAPLSGCLTISTASMAR